MHNRPVLHPLKVLLLAVLWGHCLPACLDWDSNDAGTGGSGTQLAGSCATTFTACGGDVTGTWAIQSICAVGSLTGTVNGEYTRGSDCGSVCTTASLTGTGSVTYAAPSVTSTESFQFIETLAFNDACFSELTGTTLSDSTCQTGANGLSGTASCAVSGSTCLCQDEQTTADSATTYALNVDSIVEYGAGGAAQETIEYCVTGNSMTQERTLPPGVSYVVQFAKQ